MEEPIKIYTENEQLMHVLNAILQKTEQLEAQIQIITELFLEEEKQEEGETKENGTTKSFEPRETAYTKKE